MSTTLGLIELLVVLLGAMGLGLYELGKLRRDRRKESDNFRSGQNGTGEPPINR